MESRRPAVVDVKPSERALDRDRDVLVALAPELAPGQLDINAVLAVVAPRNVNVRWNRMVSPCSISLNSR